MGAQRDGARRSEELQVEGPRLARHASADSLGQGCLRSAVARVPEETKADPRRAPPGRGDGRALFRAEEGGDEVPLGGKIRRQSGGFRRGAVRSKGLLSAATGLHYVLP